MTKKGYHHEVHTTSDAATEAAPIENAAPAVAAPRAASPVVEMPPLTAPVVTAPAASGTPAEATIYSHRFRSAYDSVAQEIMAVDPTTLVSINVDVTAVVIMVLGRETELATFHDAVVKELPSFDVSKLDKIVTYALALGFAHSQYNAASPTASAGEIVDELTKTREVFVSDVSALAKRGFLDGGRLSELRGTNGHQNLVFDILQLVAMVRNNWSAIAGKTGIQEAELARAEWLTDQLAAAVGQKEQGPATVGPEADMRQRAYTLFFRAYDQVRRAIGYLRWDQDDQEKFAPSLFAGRGGTSRRKDTQNDPATPPAATDPTVPAAPVRVPDAPTPTAPLGPVTATPTGSNNGVAPKPAVALGMPGGDPLGRG